MRHTILHLILLILTSCGLNDYSDKSENLLVLIDNEYELDNQNDKIDLWISADYLEAIEMEISICDCWKNNKYHFLHFDTVKEELFLKSNLLHFGHDSEITVSFSKNGNNIKSDSIINNFPLEVREFEIPENDTLIMFEGGKKYKFIRFSRKNLIGFFKDDKKLKNNYEISDLFYQLNSRLLLKYSELDKSETTSLIFTPDSLEFLILNDKVTGTCSDDFNLDEITIKDEKNRHFILKFEKEKLTIYEYEERSRHQKITLDNLPKQVMLTKKNKN